MEPENNKEEQNRKIQEMNYTPEQDIFNQEERVPLDPQGNPVTAESQQENSLDVDLDVPGAAADDDMEKIGSEDEENNYYSRSDNADNHEEINDDLIN